MGRAVYIPDLKITIAGPEPGFLNFIVWLFKPFEPPPPLPPPPEPTPEEREAILRFHRAVKEHDDRQKARQGEIWATAGHHEPRDQERACMGRSVYIPDLKITIAGPEPGFLNFIVWLFKPFEPPPPLPPPPEPTPEEREAILRFHRAIKQHEDKQKARYVKI